MRYEERWKKEQIDRLNRQLDRCPFCRSGAKLKRSKNRTQPWEVTCFVCTASVRSESKESAVAMWNQRSEKHWVPLEEDGVSYLLPSGQKFAHLMVHEDGKVTLIDYGDEQIYASIDVDLGRFRVSYLRSPEDTVRLLPEKRAVGLPDPE